MSNTWKFKKSVKVFFAKLFTPVFLWFQKKYPVYFEKILKEAGSLDYSAMQEQFNSLHEIFFQNMLSKIQCDKFDLENIRQASQKGPIVYMMRNWGQIEYNYFNSLFLREQLPLAAHANLIHMFWWMPLKNFFYKTVARLHYFYTQGTFPDLPEKESIAECLKSGKTPFIFLNLPILLNFYRPSREDLLLPLLEHAKAMPEGQKLTLIPLDFLYDRRPGKANKSLIDILFGEKENPGSLRKMILFFRNYRKHALAKVGKPLDIRDFVMTHDQLSLAEQSRVLRNQLHRDFYKDIFTVTGPPLKSRETMIDLTLQDKDLRQNLLRLSPELQKPIDRLYLESQDILEEIVSDPNYTYLELWDFVLRWVFKNIYDGLIIDEAGLSQLKNYAKKSPLILVPSHRSHMDYLLLSDIFYQQKLSMPLVAAGSNLSFWPLGHIFRKSGAYFLRRSFGNDPLYPLLFKSYTKTLLKEGYFQEFFIEGTRSRTGKLEEPRTGMLSLYLDCFFENGQQDFHFIPVSINYEKVLEDKSHVQESKGGKKEKESFRDLLKIGKFLRHRYGHVYVNFGKAISMKDYLSSSELHQNSDESEKRRVLKKLALLLCKEIEKISVVTAPSLVAAALLSHDKKGQSQGELFRKTEAYLKALRLMNTRLSLELAQDSSSALQQALKQYLQQKRIQSHQDKEEIFFTLEDAQRADLDYYKNSMLPPLIHLCLGSWMLQNFTQPLAKSSFASTYEKLRRFFSHEFTEIPSAAKALEDLCQLGIIQNTPSDHIEILHKDELPTYGNLVLNLMEAYRLCAETLGKMQFVKWDEKTLVQKILAHGNILYLKGDLQKPEALSQFLIKNAIHSLRDEKLLLSHEKEMGKKGRKTYSSRNAVEELQKWEEIFSGKFDIEMPSVIQMNF